MHITYTVPPLLYILIKIVLTSILKNPFDAKQRIRFECQCACLMCAQLHCHSIQVNYSRWFWMEKRIFVCIFDIFGKFSLIARRMCECISFPKESHVLFTPTPSMRIVSQSIHIRNYVSFMFQFNRFLSVSFHRQRFCLLRHCILSFIHIVKVVVSIERFGLFTHQPFCKTCKQSELWVLLKSLSIPIQKW